MKRLGIQNFQVYEEGAAPTLPSSLKYEPAGAEFLRITPAEAIQTLTLLPETTKTIYRVCRIGEVADNQPLKPRLAQKKFKTMIELVQSMQAHVESGRAKQPFLSFTTSLEVAAHFSKNG